MIRYVKGNILESDAEALVNPVNCVGVMGKGLALQFKKSYPSNFNQYVQACKAGKLKPGIVYPVFEQEKWILNFPTKRHWRQKSKLEYIEQGLQDLIRIIETKDIQSVAVSALGCGLGGLNWDEVKKLIEQYLGSLDIDIYVYEPSFMAP
ncbi:MULTISPECIES: macro domain-containing protein [unclassified Thermoactinomyces]|jgi:O-acetyl-ADP-ribose deacetylase (regulator of RNase III)|uniref:macro domain-containing protein n=1 Tax=unclassified Thermoactinomyces TaxID=2634588 RepID=UPI0018DBC18D|nr:MULTISPECIES: macro domain-containing protein [unclassified Thermoactinomyces]MBH8599603.1 macro domain-containing protein [Thermoactinomyces sp. CICC 10523]MBH8605658.1 macro domain-containing protein [Thermoactinomyces sp. CICC 10522]MBH8609422.1 macro domain-containing protein [Thermoactinomyces sp. CICC 10521]